MQDLQVRACNLKNRNQCKNLKQPLHAFIPVSGDFFDFGSYFKALIHFLKLQLGKDLFRQ